MKYLWIRFLSWWVKENWGIAHRHHLLIRKHVEIIQRNLSITRKGGWLISHSIPCESDRNSCISLNFTISGYCLPFMYLNGYLVQQKNCFVDTQHISFHFLMAKTSNKIPFNYSIRTCICRYMVKRVKLISLFTIEWR